MLSALVGAEGECELLEGASDVCMQTKQAQRSITTLMESYKIVSFIQIKCNTKLDTKTW